MTSSTIIDLEWQQDSGSIKVNLKHIDNIIYVKRKVNRTVYVDLRKQNDPMHEYYGHFYASIWEEESDEITEDEKQEILNHPYITCCLKGFEKREAETADVKEELYKVMDNLYTYIKLRLSEKNPYKDMIIREKLFRSKQRVEGIINDYYMQKEGKSNE